MFLSLATTATFGTFFTPTSDVRQQVDIVQILFSLIGFLQKYEAHRVLKSALACVEKLVNKGKMTSYTGLVVGAAADDVATCVAALSRPLTCFQGSVCIGDIDPAVMQNPNGIQVNPSIFPWMVWRNPPCQYNWALTRSWIPEKIEGFAARFEKHVQLAKEYDSERK